MTLLRSSWPNVFARLLEVTGVSLVNSGNGLVTILDDEGEQVPLSVDGIKLQMSALLHPINVNLWLARDDNLVLTVETVAKKVIVGLDFDGVSPEDTRRIAAAVAGAMLGDSSAGILMMKFDAEQD